MLLKKKNTTRCNLCNVRVQSVNIKLGWIIVKKNLRKFTHLTPKNNEYNELWDE